MRRSLCIWPFKKLYCKILVSVPERKVFPRPWTSCVLDISESRVFSYLRQSIPNAERVNLLLPRDDGRRWWLLLKCDVSDVERFASRRIVNQILGYLLLSDRQCAAKCESRVDFRALLYMHTRRDIFLRMWNKIEILTSVLTKLHDDALGEKLQRWFNEV